MDSIQQGGYDLLGSKYSNIEQMWNIELKMNLKGDQFDINGQKVVKPIGSIQNWYQNANEYWNTVDATIEGVLGGLGFLHDLDIAESNQFLKEYFSTIQNDRGRVLDCGAGIGRISKHLLTKWFQKVDLIDQCEKYIETAKIELKDSPQVEHFYAMGLQEFTPTETYDCIWIQWVASHLIDEHLISFLKMCTQVLNKNGFIFIKENITEGKFVVDKVEDYSIVRTDQQFKNLFSKANCVIVKERMQPNFPKELFKVKQYALQIKKI